MAEPKKNDPDRAVDIQHEGLESLIKDPKATEDFSAVAEDLIPKAKKMVQAGRIDEAIEELLALEKKARVVSNPFFNFQLSCVTLTDFY